MSGELWLLVIWELICSLLNDAVMIDAQIIEDEKDCSWLQTPAGRTISDLRVSEASSES
jgi:hypothetical protein